MQEQAWAPRLDLLDCCLYKNIFFFFSPGVSSVGGTACRATKEMVLECLSSQLAGGHPELGLREGASGEKKLGKQSSCLGALQFWLCPRDGESCSLDG